MLDIFRPYKRDAEQFPGIFLNNSNAASFVKLICIAKMRNHIEVYFPERAVSFLRRFYLGRLYHLYHRRPDRRPVRLRVLEKVTAR